ncbi:MAG: GAF domain-containing protein [Chloroflexi bacterium]|nr:GAF domain-containing protein [Chloroflexota bacterium]
MTLQKKISIFVLALLAAGLGLFSWLGVKSVNESVDEVFNERLAMALLMARQLDGALSQVVAELQSVAEIGNELPGKERFESMASSLREALASSLVIVRHVVLVDSAGTAVRLVPLEPAIEGTNLAGYPEVQQTLQSGILTVSNLVSSPQFGRPVVLITVPLFDEKGSIVGGLLISIDMEASQNYAFNPVVTVGKTGYIEIVDGNGFVLTRTAPGSPPGEFEESDHPGRFAEIISQKTPTVGRCHRCHETETQIERRRDVLAFAPLSFTSWGIVIRQSEEEALALTRLLQQRFLFLGGGILFSGVLLTWVMMQGIVIPIRTLTVAAKRVANGDFETVIPLRPQTDETGELSGAFKMMTHELSRYRDELTQRNRELSALNSITATVSQSLALEDVLENALRKVLEITQTSTGCVFLRVSGESRLKVMVRRGSDGIFQCQEAGTSDMNCACHQVLLHGHLLMVNDVSQCPRLADAVADGITFFVSVPLNSKDKTLGIMNLTGSNSHYYTEGDFRLLASIGSHVGLAIENSMLYEEAKQKEKIRGQLLQSAITAQEEERKRIARELHDELGQTLTGLIMSIESLENMTSLQQAQLREKLSSVKSLVSRTLDDLRRLTLDLRPSVLDDLGLVPAVRAYVTSRLGGAGVQIEFEIKGMSGRIAPMVETALFRIIQEAVNNIVKHAGATHARIRLEVKDDMITATVEDDGRGFDIEETFESRVGKKALGLLGIKERVILLGGSFDISSRPEEGTSVMVRIPLAISTAGSDSIGGIQAPQTGV